MPAPAETLSAPLDVPDAETQGTATPAEPLASPTPDAGVASATPAAEGEVMGSGADGLRLEASGSSWVEVTDSAGKRLVYGLLDPGTKRTVAGKPPYQVVLGNASAISMAMNGQPVDVAAHTSPTGTARFSVGP
jgi:cytoskeleton protein RodZ